MSLFNDIDWTMRGNDENCVSNAEKKLRNHAKKFLQGHWTFPGPGSDKKWCGGSTYPPNGEWDSTANQTAQRFKETGRPVFKSISFLSRGILKRMRGFKTIHFNGYSSNTDLLFQTAHSANQLSGNGAVANRCGQFGLTEEEKGRDNLSVNKSIVTSVPPNLQFLLFLPTSLQEKILSFDASSSRIQDDAWLQHSDSARVKYRSRPTVWVRIVPSCREYTFSRGHPSILSFCSNSWGNQYWPSWKFKS